MLRRRSNVALPVGWQAVARDHLRQWAQLDDAQRMRLQAPAARLLAKRWEASHGFALDDTMRLIVALHAALLHLGHDDEPFTNVTAIVVHPTTMVLRGQRPGPSPWVVTDAPLPALGHTSARGPVFIAWDAVERDLGAPHSATNVILHEFAHKIDALNGVLDGTPRLAGATQLREWIEVCTAAMAALRRGEGVAMLRPYAATNPSEFFAVATEAFFERPVGLQAQAPALYRVLAGFYRQDPAGRAATSSSVTFSG